MSPYRCTGVGTRLQEIENFHLLTYSHRRGEPFDQFLQLLEAYMRPSTLQKLCKFDIIRFTVYEILTEEPRVSHLSRIYIFRAPCRKNYALDRKMVDTS